MSSNPRYGKGDRYRPVDGPKYRAEYERIFGKRKHANKKRPRPEGAK